MVALGMESHRCGLETSEGCEGSLGQAFSEAPVWALVEIRRRCPRVDESAKLLPQTTGDKSGSIAWGPELSFAGLSARGLWGRENKSHHCAGGWPAVGLRTNSAQPRTISHEEKPISSTWGFTAWTDKKSRCGDLCPSPRGPASTIPVTASRATVHSGLTLSEPLP